MILDLIKRIFPKSRSLSGPGAPLPLFGNPETVLLSDSDRITQFKGLGLSVLMTHIWESRPDLQKVFDLSNRRGQIEYCRWFLANGLNEYGLPDTVYSDDFLKKMTAIKTCKNLAKKIVIRKSQVAISTHPKETAKVVDVKDLGCNVIGYATRAFGMGQQVRSVAVSLRQQELPICVLDQANSQSQVDDDSLQSSIVTERLYKINLFNIYADMLPAVYMQYGAVFFSSGYNIGYWGWELSECPPQFDLAFSMVDEVWAISKFVYDALKQRSPVPVKYMPLAIEKPVLAKKFDKTEYGLIEQDCVFLFTFDAASYMERKNPVAVVRAFKKAFDNSLTDVKLVMKTMNVDSADKQLWAEFLQEAHADNRISIIQEKLSREKLMGLYDICDVFISLHRSEGLGLCIAEAMLWGKPVIATNYSGSLEFTKEGIACLVDYHLVPVPLYSYLFSDGQYWAEPSVDHAASHMLNLYRNEQYRCDMGMAGKQYVEDNFNSNIIGQRYLKRLRDISVNTLLKDSGGLS